MGLFDWLRPRAKLPITVWLDDESRLAALATDTAGDLASGSHVMLVAHFPAAMVRVGQRLAAAGVPFATKSTWGEADVHAFLASKAPHAIAVLAEKLPAIAKDAVRPEALSGSRRVAFRVLDLHVLAAENERVERYARHMPCAVRLSASTSFEDPVMREFASPWVATMMRTLGLGPGQSIDSPMVANGLRKALAKLERQVQGNQRCDSLEEWLQRNRRR
jgi:hypothetical protein